MLQIGLLLILVFVPNHNHSAVSGAIVLEVGHVKSNLISSPANEHYDLVTYYPQCTAKDGACTVVPATEFDVMMMPAFDSNYLVSISDLSYGGGDVSVVRTPSATLEVAANDFDSTYGVVGEKSHFHIGPIHLSNGQVSGNDYALRISGHLYRGDVTSTTPSLSWTAHGTMDISAGSATTGEYMKLGILTKTFSQALNASETLYMSTSAQYGEGRVSTVISIPVQPTV